VNVLLCDKLFDGPPELRQAYARLLLSEVAVTSSEIGITGPKSGPALFASTELGDTAPSVLSFVHKRRALRDKTDNWQIQVST
jgi:site-specific DNA recombinase